MSLSANHELLLNARRVFLLPFLALIYYLLLFNLLALKFFHFMRDTDFLPRVIDLSLRADYFLLARVD